jgi:hypothetical protein
VSGIPRLPRLFVGSSTEGLGIAYAIQENLEFDAETTVWTQGIFKPTRNTLAELIAGMRAMDFVAFVFSPDDLLSLRGEAVRAVRDNVIFELGLFIGHLGPERCFFVQPRGLHDLHLPTDLLGLAPLTFNPLRSDDNLVAALGTACNQIRAAMQRASTIRKPDAELAADMPENAAEKLERLTALWSGESLQRDWSVVAGRMPMWTGDDEDGSATDALTRVYTFLDSMAATIAGNPALEEKARPIFDLPVRRAWELGRSYFVNFAHSTVDEHWQGRPLPPVAHLAERWATSGA